MERSDKEELEYIETALKRLPLNYYPHKDLKTKCGHVVDFNAELDLLTQQAIAVMRGYCGIGLAANQVGQIQRWFVFNKDAIIQAIETSKSFQDENLEEIKQYPSVIINPEIVNGTETGNRICKEGCLSFPNIYANVKRFESFELKYHDVSGDLQTVHCTGIFSNVVQHEMDHLDGKTLLDVISPFEYDKIIKKVNKQRKRLQKLRGKKNG